MADKTIRTFIIDGNNLIGKIPELRKSKGDDSRAKLIFLLQNFFSNKKVKCIVCFDGYPTDKIKSRFELLFSLNRNADELIKQKIEKSVRNKNLIIVSSDLEIFSYARECGCTAIKSEEFYKNLLSNLSTQSEEKPQLNDLTEFKKLFNVE